MHVHAEPGTEHVEQGIDLTEYYINVEWDILKVPAERHVKVKKQNSDLVDLTKWPPNGPYFDISILVKVSLRKG